jgi:peptidylprolyl isomerase
MVIMQKKFNIFSLLCLLVATSLVAEEKAPPQNGESPANTVEIGKISEAFGHVISKNLENIGVKFDMHQVIKGLHDATAGKEAPMSEMECIQAIASVQEKVFKQQCAENLKKADAFLADNSKAEGVVAIEEGKVQYQITEEGAGAIIEAHHSPLIKYTGKHLDGSVFGASKEEETISLDEIIPGLKAGLLGMKEGEKRTVYIHPDLAYGTNGYLPPNSLLTFDLEIIKANAPVVEAIETSTSASPEDHTIADVKTTVR